MIRAMRIDDWPRIVELENELFSHPWSEDEFLFELEKNPYASYWVVEDKGLVFAYLGTWFENENVQITTLGVCKNRQGKGYARMLMAHLMVLVKKHHAEKISLEVRKSNQVAIELYESFGFKQVAIRKDYYIEPVEDAYLMLLEVKGDQHENTLN